MKHTKWLTLMAVVVLALVLAACGGGDKAATTEAPAPTTAPVATEAAAPTQAPKEVEETLTCDDPLGCVEVGPNDPIRIGYALVVSGPNETLGVDSRRGIEIAIDDRGDVLGHPIELVGEDSLCSAEGGQTAATKLASDSTLLGVIGTNCSSAGEPAAAIISDAGMVLISPSNTAPSLTDPATHQPGYLRTAHNDKVQGRAMAEFAYNVVGARTAATIHDGSPYAEQLQQVFADVFTELGGTIVAQEAVNVGDTDMRPVLTSIAVNQPDYLYYPIFIAEGGFITRQAKEVAGLENTVLAGSDGMISPDFIAAAGEAAEGMFISGPNLAFENELGKHFLEAHKAKYGEDPLSAFHAHAYDATNMLLNAIEKVAKVGKDGSIMVGRQALRDALYATKDMPGITGNITCDENGDCADPQIVINQIQNGEYVPYWSEATGLLGEKTSGAAEPPTVAEPPTDPLGVVKIGPNDPIRIGYALVVSGPNETLGVDSRRGIEIAIDDRGEVFGHPVELVGEDSLCSAEGGQTAATKLASDSTLLGVIGTNCSSAGEPAAAILSDAGMVLISPSNTAPSLTDPATHQPGYLRTAHNDKVQGRAMAEFAYNVVGARTAATIHDGSPYAEQLQQVFADVFTELGGKIVAQEAVNVGDTDMRPVLTSIAVNKPDYLYYPIFIAEGGFITRQAKEVAGLENTVLAGSDGMISPDFIAAAGEAAEGMYISGPNLAFQNELGKHFLEAHQAKYGEDPLSAFHAHAYDATNMLLDAVEKVAVKDADGNLYIGRQALRDALFATSGMKGITGTITCNEYGDCADPQIVINQIQNGEYVPVWP
ncbi:MAG: ABC transporter substrate-binding protein [Chloroflexi bacterium]|nr:ABC transporter substrate-binding protein [Chloroflexota bacterium]